MQVSQETCSGSMGAILLFIAINSSVATEQSVSRFIRYFSLIPGNKRVNKQKDIIGYAAVRRIGLTVLFEGPGIRAGSFLAADFSLAGAYIRLGNWIDRH